MITKFKLFEMVTMKPKSAWIIYGDKTKIITILERIKKQSFKKTISGYISTYHNENERNRKSIDETIDRIYRDNAKNYIGFILYYSDFGFSYSIVVDNNDKERLLKQIKDIYEFKGELKIENNNQLILDTIEVDAKKYNL